MLWPLTAHVILADVRCGDARVEGDDVLRDHAGGGNAGPLHDRVGHVVVQFVEVAEVGIYISTRIGSVTTARRH